MRREDKTDRFPARSSQCYRLDQSVHKLFVDRKPLDVSAAEMSKSSSSRTSTVTTAAAGMLFLLACWCCFCLLPTAAIDAEPFMSMDALSPAFKDNEGPKDAEGTAEAQALGASPLSNACPESCEDIFPLLQPAVRGKVQDIDIQVRGEPKSGTGMLAEWAWDALAHVCLYLERLYGKSSCSIAWLTNPDNPTMPGYPHSIVFEPALGKNDTTPPLCPCDSIRVARFKLTAAHKHELPVSSDCSWHRTPGTTSGKDRVCTPVDKSPVVNGQSLWDCIRNNQCKYLDDRLQLAVLRHPGAVTVSAYYQFRRMKMLRADNKPDQNLVDINTFFVAHLAAVTKWISVRYMVFSEMLPQNQTEIFFFEDAISDPVDWHRRFYSFAGINLPPPMVHRAAEIAQNGRGTHNDTSLASEQPAFTANGDRSFRDELKPDTLAYMDSVLRIWLPSELLEKFSPV